MTDEHSGTRPATRAVTSFVSCRGWSPDSTSAMSESACGNSRGCRRAFRSPKRQGRAKPHTNPSPNAGRSESPCGPTRRHGAISPASADFQHDHRGPVSCRRFAGRAGWKGLVCVHRDDTGPSRTSMCAAPYTQVSDRRRQLMLIGLLRVGPWATITWAVASTAACAL